jgi:hypothetical protein
VRLHDKKDSPLGRAQDRKDTNGHDGSREGDVASLAGEVMVSPIEIGPKVITYSQPATTLTSECATPPVEKQVLGRKEDITKKYRFFARRPDPRIPEGLHDKPRL